MPNEAPPDTIPPDIPRRLTTFEVSEILRVSTRTVRELFNDGRLPGVQLGNGQITFKQADVEEWWNKQSRWLTAAQVAEQLGVSVRAVYQFVHTGKLKAHELSGRSRDRFRFKQSDVDRVMRRHVR